MKAKNIKKILLVMLLNLIVLQVNAQEKATILKYPEAWRLEKIVFPLDFAKDIPWKGYEELRFSPGMFNAKSPEYFTYYFGMQIVNRSEMTTQELTKELEKYYRGLCKAVNSKNRFTIDYDKIVAKVTKVTKHNFKATIVFYDSFTNGKKVLLEMMLATKEMKNKHLFLLATVIPKANSKNLKALHEKNLEYNFPK
ncbi:hypothetical protein [Tenacibaculum amylolyticum]|uniref:hypothetical protein n=1 Tax=Tenacibaculum amylolyticum TaxID=104269 RepID=UPI003895B46A